MAFALPNLMLRITDANSVPVSGGGLYVFLAGTVTPVIVFSNSALTVPLSVPVVADSGGLIPAVYMANGTYKIRVTTAAGATLYEIDNYVANSGAGVSNLTLPTTTKTANYTIQASDQNNVILADPSGALGQNILISADSSSLGNGFPIWINNTGTVGSVTIQGIGVQTINGFASFPLQIGSGVGLVSTGVSGWRIISTGVISAGVIQSTAPTGTVLEYYGVAAPTGYLFANGAAVSRTSYAALFAVIGVAGGSGDGSTTFNLPDKRGNIAVGADNMGGAATNKVQVTTTITTVIGSAAATVASATGLCSGMKVIAAGVTAGTTILTIVGTAVTLSALATASAAVAGRFSIFTDAQVVGSVGGETAHQLTVAELASHTHSYSTVGYTTNSGGTQLVATNGGAGATSPSATGNDVVHNNIQPSIICNFIIKI